MNGKKRLVQFELLRLTAMIMIIMLHYLSRVEGWELRPDAALSLKSFLGTFLESACVIAVNLYLLISGYFMNATGYKVSRVVKLYLQIWFYAFVIPIILTLIGSGGFYAAYQREGVYGLLPYVFPILTEHYWFATAYMGLALISPLLMIGVEKLTKKQFQIIVAGLLILLCVPKSVLPFDFAFDTYGYSIPWFVCMYLLGAYYRRYPFRCMDTGKKSVVLYLLCTCGNVGVRLLCYGVYQRMGELEYYFDVPSHYNFILNVIGAIALFSAFEKLKLKEGAVSNAILKMGGLSFGIYLFQEHVDLRHILYANSIYFYGGMTQWGIWGEVLHLIITVAVIFTLGLVIEAIRTMLFTGVGKLIKNWKLTKGVYRLDSYFVSK